MKQMTAAWPSYTVKVEAPEATVFVRLAYEDGRPRHLWVGCGKAGSTAAGMADALSRVCSKYLRHSSVGSLVYSLRGITHDRSGQHEAASVPDAVGIALEAIREYRDQEVREAA